MTQADQADTVCTLLSELDIVMTRFDKKVPKCHLVILTYWYQQNTTTTTTTTTTTNDNNEET